MTVTAALELAPFFAGAKPTRKRTFSLRWCRRTWLDSGTLSVAALLALDSLRLTVLRLRPRAVTRPASKVWTVMNAVLPTTLWPTMRTPHTAVRRPLEVVP